MPEPVKAAPISKRVSTGATEGIEREASGLEGGIWRLHTLGITHPHGCSGLWVSNSRLVGAA